MKKSTNIVKFRTRREVNIGLTIAVALVLLFVFQIYHFLTSAHLSVYEVREGKAGGEVCTSAMIVRDETAYKTSKAGYVNYYFRDGARVSKGAKVYSLNDSSNLEDLLNMTGYNAVLNESDLYRLKKDISSYLSEYNDASFDTSYKMVESFMSDYLRYRDLSLLEQINVQKVNSGGFYTEYAEKSGVISLYSDAYDQITVEEIRPSMFEEQARVVPERIKETSIYAIDDFSYKLINGSEWKLVFPITNDVYTSLMASGETIRFQIIGDDRIYEKKYDTFRSEGALFLVVDMQRYVSEYLDSRFLDIKILLNVAEGLKIPKTSIVVKELYQIPERFVTRGNGSDNELGLCVEAYNSQTGSVNIEFFTISPLFYEDGYYFISSDSLPAENFVDSIEEGKEPERAMMYSFLTRMEGVYNMNKGYAVFKRIARITDIDDYILVKKGLSGGVALYDHIILDTSAVTKDAILTEGVN